MRSKHDFIFSPPKGPIGYLRDAKTSGGDFRSKLRLYGDVVFERRPILRQIRAELWNAHYTDNIHDTMETQEIEHGNFSIRYKLTSGL